MDEFQAVLAVSLPVNFCLAFMVCFPPRIYFKPTRFFSSRICWVDKFLITNFLFPGRPCMPAPDPCGCTTFPLPPSATSNPSSLDSCTGSHRNQKFQVFFLVTEVPPLNPIIVSPQNLSRAALPSSAPVGQLGSCLTRGPGGT